MQVKELMSKNIASVTPDTPIVEVAKIMKKMNIGSVPVCDGDRIIGILTDRDIVLRDVAMGKNVEGVTAKDVMTVGISTAEPEMDIHEAAKLMSDKQVRRLPVVDDDRLVGMLALGDIAVRTKLEDNAGDALSDISKPTHTLY